MRLIDADKLLEDYKELADCDFIHPLYENTLREIIDDAPTVEVCEDCISREMALKESHKICIDGDVFDVVQAETLFALPSVQPQRKKGKWIPVSGRLPEDYIHVLCQFTLGGMGECYLAHGVFHVVGGLVMTCNEVIAWMPLPEPYKAESEDV